jgi:hypothetical protein
MAKPDVVFDDRIWREVKKRIEKAGASHVRVGVLSSKGGSEPHGEGGLSLVEIAAVHEFGSTDGHVPERSFIRRAMVEHEGEIVKKQAELSKAVIAGTKSVDTALDELGVFATALVKKTIGTGASIPPTLKDSTVARKGSSRALIDTGQLIGSINHEVEDHD